MWEVCGNILGYGEEEEENEIKNNEEKEREEREKRMTEGGEARGDKEEELEEGND